jgi:hypothetical protein
MAKVTHEMNIVCKQINTHYSIIMQLSSQRCFCGPLPYGNEQDVMKETSMKDFLDRLIKLKLIMIENILIICLKLYSLIVEQNSCFKAVCMNRLYRRMQGLF